MAALDAGDVDAAMALVTADARITERTLGSPAARDDYIAIREWQAAQGTRFTEVSCTGVQITEGVRVRCTYGLHEAPEQAAGLDPWPAEANLTITNDGITAIAHNHSSAIAAYEAFWRWVARTKGSNSEVILQRWETREQARHSGALTRQYAEDWAAFLAEATTVPVRLLVIDSAE